MHQALRKVGHMIGKVRYGAGVGDVDNEWMIGGAAFCCEDLGHGNIIVGIGA